MLVLQGLAFFRQGHEMTQKICYDVEERMFQMRGSMEWLREELRAAQDKAEEEKRHVLAEKDAVITQISRSLMEQGNDLVRVEKERDVARAEQSLA